MDAFHPTAPSAPRAEPEPPKPSGIRRWTQLRITLALAALWLTSPTAGAATPVATLEVEASDGYAVTRSYAGVVVANRQSALGFRHAGEVERIDVDLGDVVATGAVLAVLDSDRLEAAVAQARADLDHAIAGAHAARAHVTLAQQTERRFRELLASGHGSEQTYDEHRLALRAREAEFRVSEANTARARAQLKHSEIALEDAQIRAPYRAIVQDRYVDEGTQVAPGQAALRIVEIRRAEVHIGLPG